MNISIFEVPEIKEQICFRSSVDVFAAMRELWKADREIFKILFLNNKHVIVDDEVHSIGDVNTSAIYPRQVFRSALLKNASSLIFVHNHPTGDCTPSAGDNDITRKLVEAGVLLDIKVLDHIIIGNRRYYSYGDQGLINEYETQFKRRERGLQTV